MLDTLEDDNIGRRQALIGLVRRAGIIKASGSCAAPLSTAPNSHTAYPVHTRYATHELFRSYTASRKSVRARTVCRESQYAVQSKPWARTFRRGYDLWNGGSANLCELQGGSEQADSFHTTPRLLQFNNWAQQRLQSSVSPPIFGLHL